MNPHGESLSEAVLEEHPDAYLVFEDRRLAFGNRAAARLFGEGKRHSLTGRTLEELLGPESRHAIETWARLTEGEGWTPPVLLECLSLDARPFSAIVTVRITRALSGPQLHVVLREPFPDQPNLERHRGLSGDFDRAESLGQLGRFALQRSAAERDWFSDGFTRIIGRELTPEGFSREQYVGHVTHAEDRGLVRHAIEQAFSHGQEFDFEHRIVRADGSLRNVRCAVAPVRGRDGGVQVVRGTLQDITERVHAAGELEHQAAWLSAILEAAVQGIITIDEQGIMHSANRAAERVFGYSSAELCGHNVSMLMPPLYSTAHDRYLQNYLDTGIRKIIGIGREVVGLRKDGTSFPLELAVSEVRVGSRRMFTGFVHDISERKRLEAEFLQSQKTEVVGRLAEGIAHDFNNLLMGIRSCANLAQELPGLDGTTRLLVQEIEGATQRGMALTRRLLAFSRNKPSQLVPVRLGEVIATNQAMLRHLIGEDIELAIGRVEAGDAILGDAGLIEQILVNLVVNARDAMPGGGRLEIEVSATANPPVLHSVSDPPLRGEVCLSVTDTGCGMDDAVLARVFEPFFTTKEPGKGTGLGLSTVQQIVKQLAGRIEVDSRPGQGTTFRITFAVYGGPIPSVESSNPRPPSTALSGSETVLLVEDDALIRSSVRRHLARLGYSVLVASDGQEALEVAARNVDTIDILITDVVMPGMGGRELAQRLVAREPGLQRIFMSAHAQDSLVEQGRLDPDVNYLEKPYDLGDLSLLIRKVLDA